MIKIDRGSPEPAALADARISALAALRPAGPSTRRDLPSTYKVAHDRLWRAQHHKCAYCESREQSKRNDVEHFRPALRYWWLAYTWENLLFSCRNCNQSPAKLDQFPLEEGSIPLAPEEVPPGGERPLLIDPGSESGVDHIEFVEDLRTKRWMPRARNGSKRGDTTIRVCRLDRPDLLDLYTHHVKANIEPDLGKLKKLIATGDASPVQEEWDRFRLRHLGDAQIYVALARDVLTTRIPETDRHAFGLYLPLV